MLSPVPVVFFSGNTRIKNFPKDNRDYHYTCNTPHEYSSENLEFKNSLIPMNQSISNY
jgi:hypothetical protein